MTEIKVVSQKARFWLNTRRCYIKDKTGKLYSTTGFIYSSKDGDYVICPFHFKKTTSAHGYVVKLKDIVAISKNSKKTLFAVDWRT